MLRMPLRAILLGMAALSLCQGQTFSGTTNLRNRNGIRVGENRWSVSATGGATGSVGFMTLTNDFQNFSQCSLAGSFYGVWYSGGLVTWGLLGPSIEIPPGGLIRYISARQTAIVPASIIAAGVDFNSAVSASSRPPTNPYYPDFMWTGNFSDTDKCVQTFGVPPPSLSYFLPQEANQGDAAVILTIYGDYFANVATVLFGATRLIPSSVSATEIRVTIPANLLVVGSYGVNVENPDGRKSESPLLFRVYASPGPTPTITSFSPQRANEGDAAVPLTITGNNFATGATVLFGATRLTPSSVSATQIQVTIPANLLVVGHYDVAVVNPDGRRGNISASFDVALRAVPAPTITSISPSSTGLGTTNFTLTLNGANFTATSVVRWNGTTLAGTRFVSPNQLMVPVLNALLAAAGTISVSVVDGAQTSNPASFTVTPIPTTTAQFRPAPSSPYTVGTNPASLAVGDFDGDGNADVAIANYGSNTVTVLLGDGAGGFSAAPFSPFAVGSYPYSVALGDFNGDGKPDLAIANSQSNTLTVLLRGLRTNFFGVEVGSFVTAPGNPFAVGNRPVSVAVGDFNGDGKSDLATANYDSNNVTVLLGNGAGGFSAASGSPFPVDRNPTSIVVGDFNGDGKSDLGIANHESNTVTVLLGNGAGGFSTAPGSPIPVDRNPTSIVVGDFNGDGKSDLAIASSPSNTVTVLLGNGAGGFSAAPGSPVAVGTSPLSIAVGDFNGDRKQDLAIANSVANNVTVLLGSGAGGFSAAPGSPFAVGSYPISAAVGDFNGDGKLDVSVANFSSNTATVLLNSFPAEVSQFTITNNASFAPQISPGSLLAIFGNGSVLATNTVSGFSLPLPTSSNGTSIMIDGVLCPLIYLSPTQINFQAPMELRPGTATVVVNNNGKTFSTTIPALAAAPGFYTTDYYANGGLAILQSSATGGLYNAASPAPQAQNVTMYFTGIGAITNNPGTGRPAPGGSGLSQATSTVTLTINGINVMPTFVGLTPGFAGLGQLNFQLPPNLPTSNAIPVVLTINGTASKTVLISVR